MKKQLVLFAFATLLAVGSISAQGGGGQRMTPEERTTIAMEKMAPLNLAADAKSKTEVIIGDFSNIEILFRTLGVSYTEE